jgi:hypothetical protein
VSNGYKTSGYNLGDVSYAKSLGPTLLEIFESDDQRLDLIFNVYKDWYREQSDSTSWIHDLEFIPLEEKKKLHSLQEKGLMEEVPDSILKKNFDATLENLNTMIFAQMGEEVFQPARTWYGNKENRPMYPSGIGGMYKTGRGKHVYQKIGDTYFQDRQNIPKWFEQPDTSFYMNRNNKLPPGYEQWDDRERAGILFHEAGLHGSGGLHRHGNRKTGQKTYAKHTADFVNLLSDEEIDLIISAMYTLPAKREYKVSPGINGKRQ